MSYQSLYRKYRPQNFNEVVGQDSIIQTLNNAIKNDKISHAYLFSGPRGCGKTSIAKIFARQVNCTCDNGTCPTCEIFATNEVSDVWEIDAASNNGVDEVRRIIDNVNYTPMDLKYKVYIIDEVHMLSKAAFNALLKTLEEPPKHVIFILATTEIYKIPLTVLSRCQRFDFKRISVNEITKRLVDVLEQEEIEYEHSALEKVAVLADGGMRDALSLIEKVRTYSEIVSLEAVNSSLQLVGVEQIDQLLSLIIAGEIKPLINYWQELSNLGIDENKFILDIQYHIRDLLIDGPQDLRAKYIKLLKLFNELEGKLQFTNNYNLVIEVYLIEMATLDEFTQKLNVKTNEPHQTIKNDFKPMAKPVLAPMSQNLDKASQQEKLEIQKKALLNQQEISVEKKTKEVANELDARDTGMIDFLMGESLDAINKEPDFQQQEKQETVSTRELSPQIKSNEQTNIIILDVLKLATVKEKKDLIENCYKLQLELETEGKYGIAKFFEYAEVQAASPIGYVLTIDQKLISSYLKRLNEIEHIFNNYLGKKVKIFLLERSEWQAKRPDYVKAIKEMKEKDIFQLAQEEFGAELVNKI